MAHHPSIAARLAAVERAARAVNQVAAARARIAKAAHISRRLGRAMGRRVPFEVAGADRDRLRAAAFAEIEKRRPSYRAEQDFLRSEAQRGARLASDLQWPA